MSDNEEQLTLQEAVEAAEETEYHTILEIWREVLKPAAQEKQARITPQWANRITSTYRELNFKDMYEFRRLYFDKIEQLNDILKLEIDSDDECLNLTTAEEDGEINAFHYINILVDWQKQFLQWELEWDPIDDFAPAELASISEVHRMFFDKTGLTALLDQIPFEFNDEHRDLLASTLQELRDSQEAK